LDFASHSSLLAEQGASALKFRICLNRRAYFDVCGGSFVLHIKWKIGQFWGCGSDDALRILLEANRTRIPNC
jgi:hypothetical protein